MSSKPLIYFTALSVAAHATLFGVWSEPQQTSPVNQETSIEVGLVVLPSIDMVYSSKQTRLQQSAPQKQIRTATPPATSSSKSQSINSETSPSTNESTSNNKITDQASDDPDPKETARIDVTPPGSAMTGSSLFIATEAAPLASTNPAPQYPAEALRYGWEGEVWLKVDVDRNGVVYRVRIDKSSGYPVLDRTALKTVQRWIFEPARIGQETIDATVRVPVRFKIRRS